MAVFVLVLNSSFVSQLIPEAKASPDGSNVVINEIYVDANNELKSEFVELYNPTNSSIDISGWTIKTDISNIDATIPAGTYIAPKGYYLITDNNWDTGKDSPSWPKSDHQEAITLSNSDAGVSLMNNSTVIDAVGYGSSSEIIGGYEGNPVNNSLIVEGKSISRKIIGQDSDDNTFDFEQSNPSPQNSYSPAPIITVDSLTTNDTTPKLTGTINDPSADITVNVDGNDYDGTIKGAGAWEADVTNALTEGVYDVQVTATDQGGNVGNDATTNELTIDTTTPVVLGQTASPNPFSPAIGDVTTIDYTISDNLSSNFTVDITIKDENGIPVKSFDDLHGTVGLNSQDWDGTGATIDGDYTVEITAEDEAGNTGTSDPSNPLIVTVDTQGPEATTGSKLNTGNTTNNNNPIVSGNFNNGVTATDFFATPAPNYDVKSIDVVFEDSLGNKYTKEATLDYDTGQYTTENSNPYNVTSSSPVIVSVLPDGIYKVTALAIDAAGNSTPEIVSSSLTIDTQAPVNPTNLQVTAKDPNSITLNWTASTSQDTAGYRLYWGTEKGKYTSARDVGNATTATVDGLTPSVLYYFKVTAYDKASNEGLASNEAEERTPEVLSAAAGAGKKVSKTEGKGVVESAQAAASEEEQIAEEPQKEEQKTQTKGRNNLFIIAIIILILGVAGYYYYSTHPDKFRRDKFPKLPGVGDKT